MGDERCPTCGEDFTDDQVEDICESRLKLQAEQIAWMVEVNVEPDQKWIAERIRRRFGVEGSKHKEGPR